MKANIKTSNKLIKLAIFIGVMCLISYQFVPPNSSNITTQTIGSAAADASILQNKYTQWRNNLSGPLIQFSLVSAQQHRATKTGMVTIDSRSNMLTVHLFQPPENSDVDLWIRSNNQSKILIDNSSHTLYLGKLGNRTDELSSLEIDLTPHVKNGFQIGQVLLLPAENNRLSSMIAGGSPSLFQRLLATELALQKSRRSTPFSNIGNLLIPVAVANEATGFPDVFNDLVTQGEDVFFNETFEGNGRSCGTCHPATNNFTIDIPFIHSLSANDPLFVAEFIPALMFGAPENLDVNGNPQRFENPALMRNFGLIVENVDGIDHPNNRFTMRSVPHNIGMSASIETPPASGTTPPDDRTGWSGDGAPTGIVGGVPASGRLKDFILGAIFQHYPKTMARSFDSADPDFRIATLDEIDAVEAFLLALGRQEELNIVAGSSNELILADPDAEEGKALFRDGVPGGNRRCQACHANAGANAENPANPGNRNFNTGVEEFLQNRLQNPDFTVVGELRPFDGGLGTNPDGELVQPPVANDGFTNENFGNNTFNSVSLVEAADTPPFFHNNIANTLEEAIEFYNSPEFLEINEGSIPFTEEEVTKVAAFLRVINAIDNLENSVLRQADRAIFAINQNPRPDDVITRIIDIMIADTEDAIEVLTEGALHNSGPQPTNVVSLLDQAVQKLNLVKTGSSASQAKINHINFAIGKVTASLALMRIAP